jgi:acetyl esterase/lipase
VAFSASHTEVLGRRAPGRLILRRRAVAIASALLGLLAVFLSVWIVVPGPTPLLFALTVGSAEIWPLIALVDAAICAVLLCWARGPVRVASFTLAVLSLATSTVPLVAYLARGPYVPLQAFLSAGTLSPVVTRTLDNGDILYAPPHAHALPILIAIYGGAWERGSPRSDRLFNERIASWGYVVVAIDYPHAPLAHWPLQREAVLRELAHVRAIAAAVGGDAGHIVLLGHSSGAQLALIAAAEREREVRAAVIYESPVDLYLGYFHPSRPDVIHIQAILRDLCGASPQAAPQCYHTASPRYIVRRGMPPVLMFVAGRDHVADLGYERRLRDTLRSNGVHVEYVELAWADHSFESVAFGFHDRIALWFLRRFLARNAA